MAECVENLVRQDPTGLPIGLVCSVRDLEVAGSNPALTTKISEEKNEQAIADDKKRSAHRKRLN